MDRLQQRGYSEAVITKGGRTVWLAGTTTVDDRGKSPASDFNGQIGQHSKEPGSRSAKGAWQAQ
jgi:hypothetical protein